MIKDINHVGYFMYPNTEATYSLPRKLSSGNWVACLTKEEQTFLSQELKADLSFSKQNNYWKERIVRIKVTEELKKVGIKIDISNPDGYLDYKILSSQEQFAPSWEERNNSLEYKFALVRSGEKLDEEYSEASIEQDAYDSFAKMKHNKEKLYDFLVRWGGNKKPSQDDPLEFLRTEAWKIVKNNPQKFQDIVNDPDYEIKVFIDKALTCKGLYMDGRTTYRLGYGSNDIIGSTLKAAILYLQDPKNQMTYLELQARIEGKDSTFTNDVTPSSQRQYTKKKVTKE